MPFTAEELTAINNSTLELYIRKGKVKSQNVENKPMLKAFNEAADSFAGGNLYVSVGVKGVGHSGALEGYSGDDQVGYYNPTNVKRARYPWKEHHIGIVVTHTELKIDGIDVIEDGADQRTSEMDGREAQKLAGLLENKLDDLDEDFNYSMDLLVHGDGSADPKALAGIGSILLDNPDVGSTGGISRVANPFWRNRARTAAEGGAIVSNATAGGTLITFMDKELRQRNRYRSGATKIRNFCGSDFIDAYKAELRANGTYTNTGWRGGAPDGSMSDPTHAGEPLIWDPTMDALGLSKRCYSIDMGRYGIRLLYMDGNRLKKHNPARPFDRYVWYNGLTTTAVMVANQLNTSGVYDIA